MTLRKMLGVSLAVVFAAATLSAFQAKPVDVSGKWDGTVTPGGSQGGPGHLELTQKGTEVTGTAGPRPDRQFPITNGKVATVKGVTGLTFDLTQPSGGVMKFDLKLVEGRLKGNVSMEQNGQKQEGTADFGRAK